MSSNHKHSSSVSLNTVGAVDLESASGTYIEGPTLPRCQVDYLSHAFSEEDVAASWKVMTKQKNAVVNGIRLENASWRTWWKRKKNLKTISPDTLNWLKDSDVTWLYGPLHSTKPPLYTPKESSTSDKFGLMQPTGNTSPCGLKSVLKRRTLTDILRGGIIPDTNNAIVDKPSMTKYPSEPEVRGRSTSNPEMGTIQQPRLRFNDQVEQCIAVSDDDSLWNPDEVISEDGAILLRVEKRNSPSIVILKPTRLKTPENKKPPERRRSYERPYFSNYDLDESLDFDNLPKEDRSYYLSSGAWNNYEDDISPPTSTPPPPAKVDDDWNVMSETTEESQGVVESLMTNVKTTVNWMSAFIFK